MNWKTPLSLVVAIALGLVTAKVGWDMVQKARNSTKIEPTKTNEVVVAKRDIDPGTQLTEDDIDLKPMPADFVPDKAFRDKKDLVGRTIVAPVVAGMTMFEGLLAPADSIGGMQSLVPPGMRAVTVEVNDAGGVGGLIAGCYVDVIATLRKGEGLVARTIVENVRVAAVNGNLKATNDPNQPRVQPSKTVTLVVTPKQAEAIDIASVNAKPRLVLRGANDKTAIASSGVSSDELVGDLVTPIAIGSPNNDSLQDILNKLNEIKSTTQPSLSLSPSVQSYDPVVRSTIQIIKGGAESYISFQLKNTPEGPAMIREDPKASETVPTAPAK